MCISHLFCIMEQPEHLRGTQNKHFFYPIMCCLGSADLRWTQLVSQLMVAGLAHVSEGYGG